MSTLRGRLLALSTPSIGHTLSHRTLYKAVSSHSEGQGSSTHSFGGRGDGSDLSMSERSLSYSYTFNKSERPGVNGSQLMSLSQQRDVQVQLLLW